MAASFSQELEDLLNPLPKFADPEDDGDEATKAKVIERFDEDDDGLGPSSLRKPVPLLSDTDARYAGEAVSRRRLLADAGEDEEDWDIEGEESDQVEDDDTDAKTDVTSTQKRDLQTLAEDLDDLGVSEEDYDMSEEAEGSDEEDEDEEVTISTFSQDKVDEEVEKGNALRNQLALWDQLLEGRIKVQKVLVLANQLPQPETFPDFSRRGGAELTEALRSSHNALRALQRSLLDLHGQLLLQDPDTRTVAGDGGEPEAEEYPVVTETRFAAFQPYCSAVLRKWHDRTRLSVGRSGGGFAGFERDVLGQVEQVLADKERLLRRTRTRRSEYRILGRREASPAPAEANAHLNDVDEDVFDDDDFYHQLLRELIERKTSSSGSGGPESAGRRLLAVQKLRRGVRRKVETRASKGRKVRFHVHGKLLSFMAPTEHGAMSDEARDKLYRSLFGQNSTC